MARWLLTYGGSDGWGRCRKHIIAADDRAATSKAASWLRGLPYHGDYQLRQRTQPRKQSLIRDDKGQPAGRLWGTMQSNGYNAPTSRAQQVQDARTMMAADAPISDADLWCWIHEYDAGDPRNNLVCGIEAAAEHLDIEAIPQPKPIVITGTI